MRKSRKKKSKKRRFGLGRAQRFARVERERLMREFEYQQFNIMIKTLTDVAAHQDLRTALIAIADAIGRAADNVGSLRQLTEAIMALVKMLSYAEKRSRAK